MRIKAVGLFFLRNREGRAVIQAGLRRASIRRCAGFPLASDFCPLAKRLPMEKLALLSVSDKSGLVEFATALVHRFGYKLLSTGGTAKLLADKG